MYPIDEGDQRVELQKSEGGAPARHARLCRPKKTGWFCRIDRVKRHGTSLARRAFRVRAVPPAILSSIRTKER
jgi:hypothetical protein